MRLLSLNCISLKLILAESYNSDIDELMRFSIFLNNNSGDLKLYPTLKSFVFPAFSHSSILSTTFIICNIFCAVKGRKGFIKIARLAVNCKQMCRQLSIWCCASVIGWPSLFVCLATIQGSLSCRYLLPLRAISITSHRYQPGSPPLLQGSRWSSFWTFARALPGRW